MVYRSDCCYLQYSIHFSGLMPVFFTRKRTKHDNTRSTKMATDRYKARKALILEDLMWEDLLGHPVVLMISVALCTVGFLVPVARCVPPSPSAASSRSWSPPFGRRTPGVTEKKECITKWAGFGQYTGTSRKRPPLMSGLGGRLREVVAQGDQLHIS